MSRAEASVAVRVEGLTVRFGDFTAVDAISFSVRRGEIFGFLGANGAGKTTTIRVLCGLLVPSSGAAEVAGIPLESGRDAEIKSKVGYMSQRFTLYEDLTVGENLEFAASLRKIPTARFRARSAEMLDMVSFRQPLATPVRELPAGLRQQVSLAASLLHDPEIVFLDEPTAGVNAVSRARFWELIRRLARGGKTMFVTSHYMDEVERCDRIALMREGRIIALDSPRGLKSLAFPMPVYELSAGGETLARRVGELRDSGVFRTLTPHGLRYHATLMDPQAYEAMRELCGAECRIQPITPSLEDVFIELVEGRRLR